MVGLGPGRLHLLTKLIWPLLESILLVSRYGGMYCELLVWQSHFPLIYQISKLTTPNHYPCAKLISRQELTKKFTSCFHTVICYNCLEWSSRKHELNFSCQMSILLTVWLVWQEPHNDSKNNNRKVKIFTKSWVGRHNNDICWSSLDGVPKRRRTLWCFIWYMITICIRFKWFRFTLQQNHRYFINQIITTLCKSICHYTKDIITKYRILLNKKIS